jgi:hypothetical protein
VPYLAILTDENSINNQKCKYFYGTVNFVAKNATKKAYYLLYRALID